MATTTESPKVATPRAMPEQRVVLCGVSWETFLRLSEEVENAGVRMAFNQGVLEFMSPGMMHEDYKARLRRLIEMVCVELAVPFKICGSTTWKRPAQARAIEADECYMLTAEKIALCRRQSNDSKDYPDPDLAVEVDISPSDVDRASIYAALRVPEVWRFNGDRLRIDRLREGGTYEAVGESLFLPIEPAEVERWVKDDDDGDEGAWERRARDWVRAEVAPRRG